MRNVGDIEEIYKAAELLNEFCSETACPECPIRKLCNKLDRDMSIGLKLIKSIEL